MKTGYAKLGSYKGTKEVFFAGCLHIGNESHDSNCLAAFLECIRNKPYFLMGDLIEAITPTDKRFSVESHEKSLIDQVREIIRIFKPYASNCLGMISGNHEDVPSNHLGDLTASMAGRDIGINVPYLTDCSIQTVICPKGQSQLFLAHPCFTVSSSALSSTEQEKTKRMSLRRRLDKVIAPSVHCRVIFHLHQGIVDPPHGWHEPHLGVVDGKLSEEYTVDIPNWSISGPSMLYTYSPHIETPNYASRKLFPPSDIGWMSCLYGQDGKVEAVRQYRSNGKIKQEWEPEIVK